MIHSNPRLVMTLVALLVATAVPAFAQPPASTAVSAVAATSDAGAAGSNRDAARARRKMNRQLVKRVAAALARTRGLDSSRILIRASDGTVTLSGTVPDNVQIPLAVNAAQQVAGVTALRNLLRIGMRTE
ncbi:BON domain-containing protein [Burkholderia ubonensis]|uniref:BON domain-containing protein n=1 Tax=Burkholderia ubonensis TaxID=101571 RepID=UPI00075DD19D|nr:BON domain-containing protein [Burkholderia ubonensis]KVD17980.1 transporter [Burkholderia ubonensis]KWC22144.1 transporter [Burkholderia ubonensis]KWC24988.1 transporter [Burkholderia ubonensis]